MTDSSASPGVCPNCGRRLSRSSRLIEYERSDGSTGVYADCPGCDEVVEPD